MCDITSNLINFPGLQFQQKQKQNNQISRGEVLQFWIIVMIVYFLVVFLMSCVGFPPKFSSVLAHPYAQNYFRYPETLPNDSYFIGSIFAGASLKICAGLLRRLWLVINKNPPEATAHRCCLRWPMEPRPGNRRRSSAGIEAGGFWASKTQR